MRWRFIWLTIAGLAVQKCRREQEHQTVLVFYNSKLLRKLIHLRPVWGPVLTGSATWTLLHWRLNIQRGNIWGALSIRTQTIALWHNPGLSPSTSPIFISSDSNWYTGCCVWAQFASPLTLLLRVAMRLPFLIYTTRIWKSVHLAQWLEGCNKVTSEQDQTAPSGAISSPY